MRDSEGGADISEVRRIVSDAVNVVTAADCAARGDVDLAESVLRQTAEVDAPAPVLDALARIAVQRGDFARALSLWEAVLQKDAANEGARLAVARLNSPWILIAVVRRIGLLAVVACLLALAGVGVWALCGLRPLVAATGATAELATAQGVRVAALPGPAPGVPSSGEADASSLPQEVQNLPPNVKPPHVVPPVFAVDGCTVVTSGVETVVVFNKGLFDYRCELSDGAMDQILQVAAAVSGNSSNCNVIVEGHTDSAPMPDHSVYRDNVTLGMHRALVVAELLRTEGGIAADRIAATSAGDENPPFLGDDYETEMRNRTVVIRLVPRMKTDEELTVGEGADDSTAPASPGVI